MANLVIVAIPSEDDYVWKISSEKVPHMTLLFLGDAVSNPNKIQEFLEHAVGILEFGPFMLNVDYRDTLGPDEADVLFFRKDWSLNRVSDFRGQLLKNNAIRTAWETSPQYDDYPDGWTPHITLGYPASPAKKDDRDYPGIRWIEFDRVALWYGDYEGPEYRLEYNYDLAEVGMSVERGQDFVAHYGVKGMKWGVRRSKEERGDKKFAKKASTPKTFVAIHNGSVAEFNDKIGAINAKYKNIDLTAAGNRAKRDAYDRDVESMMEKAYQNSANRIRSKSGNLQYHLEFQGDGTFKITTKQVKHDDVITGTLKRDKKGYITGYEIDEMTQSALGEEFVLTHYGVKGMKWGVRRAASPREAQAQSVVRSVGKTKVKATGGENQPAHIDAIKAATFKQKLKKSGHASLSNQELQDLANRLNLEQQVSRLMSTPTKATSPGKQFVAETLTGVGKQQTQRLANEAATAATNQLFKKGKKQFGFR
jgi:2'-5' RNA ligase